MRSRRILLVMAVALFVCAALATAQAPTATLVGRIVDSSHAAVPGAAIKVRNLDTNQVRTATSLDDGEYTVSALAPGFYEVTIEKSGFKTERDRKLELQADQSARLDLELAVGAVTESIEVTATATLLNTEVSSRGAVITPTEIAEIPLNGRDFNDLAFSVAGVQPAEESAKGSPYVVNGARADASNVMIDGVNDQTPRDASAQARPPLDSLQEFKLLTTGYSAEYGRLAGGVVNMVLKSGGNQVHGSLFEYWRNDAMDARNFYDQAVKSELRRNQFGGLLGGPVMIPKLFNGHDRTFFLISWESYRQVSGSNQVGIVPTALERKGDFSQSVDATGKLILVKDPLATGSCTATVKTACFPGNVIPSARFSPIAVNLMAYYPLPNLSGASNFIANIPSIDNWDNFLFKVDQRLSSKDSFSMRALLRWESSTNPFSGTGLGGFGATTDSTQELYSASETRVITPSLINEFRVGVTRTVSAENSSHAGTNYASLLGITGTTTDPNLQAFPKFTVTGFETIGDSTSNPIRYAVTNYNFNDAVTWNKGRHSIKFGGDYLFTQYYQPTNSNFNGTFAFNGKTTNDAIGDLLLGFTSSTSRKTGTVTNHIKEYALGGFIQDDYKMFPSLTLNIGLRYEIQGAPYEKDGLETSYVPGIGKAIVGSAASFPNFAATVASLGLTGQVGVASDYGLPASLINTNYDNFAPRVGFAWRPFSGNRTVIRSGYGVFYTGSRLAAMRTDITGGFPFSVSQSFTGSTSNPNLLTLANPFPASLAKVTGTTTTSGYEVNPPSPYLQSWNFTIERELAKDIAIEIGYTGSKGTHLGRKYDINQQVRLPNNALPGGVYPRPYPGFTDIEYYSFGFNSSYEAGTVTLHRNLRNLTFRANYTFGKSIDVNSGFNYAGAGGYQGAQNSLNPTAERGRSDFDIRHVFSMTFVAKSPFRQNFFVKGWQLSGLGTLYSGQPFTPQYSGPNSDLASATRPDRLATGSLANPTNNGWFDLNAFQLVPDSAFRFGNSGRNILDSPGTIAVNLSLAREFQIRERSRFQLRWETFNFTNHTNFKTPVDTLDKANAGSITSAKAARVMQVALKYQF